MASPSATPRSESGTSLQSVVSKVTKPSKKAGSSKKSTSTSKSAVASKPVKQAKGKAPVKPKESSVQLPPISEALPSPILEDSSRDHESLSEAAPSLLLRQVEPSLPAGVSSLTQSQLTGATAGLTSASHSPMPHGQGSLALLVLSAHSRLRSPHKKRSSKRKHCLLYTSPSPRD